VQCARGALQIVGRPWTQGTEPPIVSRHYVAPAHFRTLRTPLLHGRAIADSDREGRPRVVVINESAAKRFWPGGNVLGQRVWFDGAQAFGSAEESAEIVGVVQDAAYQPLDDEPMQPGFFTSYAQFTYATRMVLVRAAGDPHALVPHVAGAVRRADPDLTLFDVQTMEERAGRSWSKQAGQTALLGVIAVIAVILAATGIYAVTAFAVASGRREIGLRMALGASSGGVVRHSLARTVRTGVFGAILGLVVALAASQLLRATLYETSPLDARVYALTVALLVAVFLTASWLPIRRAIRIDPAEVLRSE
jgi:putative ABC transport system permease protein